MLADAPRVYQNLGLIRCGSGRMSGLERADWAEEGQVVAVQRDEPRTVGIRQISTQNSRYWMSALRQADWLAAIATRVFI